MASQVPKSILFKSQPLWPQVPESADGMLAWLLLKERNADEYFRVGLF